ncbi:MAG: hypothetical protein IAF38_11875 [Bacteroidia bacterium]|nr:hypothetical protein [Bacteroidia bacterium]
MKKILLIISCIHLFSGGVVCAQTGKPPAKANDKNSDSIKFRQQNIDKWYKELRSNNDSVVKFGFYLSQDYLALKKKLDKYESVPKAELLIDELNDLMFSGGDPVHNPSNMENLGEVGHFFEETKKKLDQSGVKYKWDTQKIRYVLITTK